MISKARAMVLASFAADSLALGAHWIYDTGRSRTASGGSSTSCNRARIPIIRASVLGNSPIMAIRPWCCWSQSRLPKNLRSSISPGAGEPCSVPTAATSTRPPKGLSRISVRDIPHFLRFSFHGSGRSGPHRPACLSLSR